MVSEWHESVTYEKSLQLLVHDAATLTWALGQFDSTDPRTAGALVRLEQSKDLRRDEIERLVREMNDVMGRIREHMTSYMRYGECDCIGECDDCIASECDCYATHATHMKRT